MIDSINGIRSALRRARVDAGPGARVILVPTMGALHAGHVRHVTRARELGDIVVVSIFVNPLQFGPGEDLGRYPRRLESDVSALMAAGADFIFAPSAAEMYPTGETATRITAGDIGSRYEGAARPGHFDGVLTVVAKLLNIVCPDVATFGQKDAQQAFLVRRMITDLDLPVTIEVVPTVREPDGLALSSRNQYLDDDQRRAALSLSAGLAAAASAAESGRDAALAAARAVITHEPAVRLDYLDVVDPQTFLPVLEDHRGPATVMVAALLGTTRLIDNENIVLK